ncbi:MAG: hypothetical protein U0414_25900 [Polyangiaceae bacterium]
MSDARPTEPPTALDPSQERDFTDARPPEAAGLRASLRDAARSPDGSGFLVRFVLENTTDKPIPIFQRWNSWGAYQWRLAIQDARGLDVVATNPQMEWTRNGPTAIAIAPGSELVLKALVQVDASGTVPPGIDRFTTGARLTFPLRVRGLFECTESAERGLEVHLGSTTIPVSELWVGSIATDWLDVD